MYYFSVHLLYASIVGTAAWVLTSIRGASATTKYWIWVVTACNFVVPVGAVVDKLWAPHLRWAAPLGAIGGPVWDMTQGRTAVVLSLVWITGALTILVRLISRLGKERREVQLAADCRDVTSSLVADGIPVSFDSSIELLQSAASFIHVSCCRLASIDYSTGRNWTRSCFMKWPTPKDATI
jgi:hypothetical protein